MQIVIELSEKDFHRICQGYLSYTDTLEGRALSAISSGVILPKHGKLIDADAFEKDNSELWGCDFIHPKYCDTLADIVSDAPTILEAWGNKE